MTNTGVLYLGRVPAGKRYEIDEGGQIALIAPGRGETYEAVLRYTDRGPKRDLRSAMTHVREPGGDRTLCGCRFDPVAGWSLWESPWTVLTCHRCVGALARREEAFARGAR